MSGAAAAPAAAKAAEPTAESITNVQHAGVDEGGIVKLHGDHLVILRRGRLFTVQHRRRRARAGLGRRRLRPRRRPARRLVRRDADLRQHHRRDRLQLRARRHRDRAVRDLARGPARATGDLPPALERLLLVAQLREPADRQQARLLHAALPQPLRRRPVRAVPGAAPLATGRHGRRLQAHRARDAHLPHRRAARSVRRASRCTRSRSATSRSPSSIARAPRCSARRDACSTCRRLGLRVDDAVAATLPRRRARPVPHPARRLRADRAEDRRQPDRPVLLPRGRDGHLNVLVRAERPRRRHVGGGDRRRRSRAAAGAARRFSDGARQRAGRALSGRCPPSGPRDPEPLRRRVPALRRGRGLAPGAAHARSRRSTRCATRASATHDIPLAHGVDRIEALGANAVVVGSDGERPAFHQPAPRARPGGGRPLHAHKTRRRARRAATASSTSRRARPTACSACRSSAAASRLAPAAAGLGRGAVPAQPVAQLHRARARSIRSPARARNDGCRASCVDWYGNARPLFVGNRVFALMGYEIVEGALSGNQIAEVQRVSFAPRRSGSRADRGWRGPAPGRATAASRPPPRGSAC